VTLDTDRVWLTTASVLPPFRRDRLYLSGGSTSAVAPPHVPKGPAAWTRCASTQSIDESAIQEDALGTRRIAGVDAVGRRITTTVPAGSRVGNDRPMTIVDERWESNDLQILIYARHSNPLTGVVEYQLSNITRAEPPSHSSAYPRITRKCEPTETVRLSN